MVELLGWKDKDIVTFSVLESQAPLLTRLQVHRPAMERQPQAALVNPLQVRLSPAASLACGSSEDSQIRSRHGNNVIGPAGERVPYGCRAVVSVIDLDQIFAGMAQGKLGDLGAYIEPG